MRNVLVANNTFVDATGSTSDAASPSQPLAVCRT